METLLINGKEIAKDIRKEVKREVSKLKEEGKKTPKLAVILVGEDPASQTYVHNKEVACEKAGIVSEAIRLPEDTSEEFLLQEIKRLNEDPDVNGILVQMPVPKHINSDHVIAAIAPEKDVDGFHAINVGKLFSGLKDGFVPCTPLGIIELLKRSNVDLKGKEALVIGRSNLVGKPVAQLLLNENATVTVAHSRTKDLPSVVSRADVVVVAVGRPKMVNGSMLKEGAVVIDVGINRTEEGLVGDVDTQSCMGIASQITPVPGGVGPMTIAMLLKNCLMAYQLQNA